MNIKSNEKSRLNSHQCKFARYMGSSIIRLGLVLASFAFGTQAFPNNLVLNGWFTGWNAVGTVPNDWTLTRATSGSFFGENFEGPGSPPEGGNAASFAATSSPTNFPGDYDEISETISTTTGAVYGVTFYLKPYPGSYFVADFGDHQLLALAPSSEAYEWTQYAFLVVADSTSMTLAFYGNGNDTGIGKLVHVSDVDVELVTPPVLSSSHFSNGGFQMTVTGTSNQTYVVEMATNLISSATNWVPLYVTNPPSSSFSFTDPNSTNQVRLYRAEVSQ
jgi:hypothetical protein